MNKPQLVAETPRAGKWNHRFIAAPNGSLSDSEVAKMIAAARRNPQGDDYLAVSAETTQSMSGRTGKEILVLTGVDVKKLSDNQRQQIIAQLGQQLIDLATLVTEKIDWDKEGQAILVKRPELGEWEKGFVGLPIFTPQQKAAVSKKPISNRFKMVGGVVGVLLVLGLGIWKIIPDSDSESSPDEKGSPSTRQSYNLTLKMNKESNSEQTASKEPSENSKANSDQAKTTQGGIKQNKACSVLEKKITTKGSWIENGKSIKDRECYQRPGTEKSLTTFKAFLENWCDLTYDPKFDEFEICIDNQNNCDPLTEEKLAQLKEDFQKFKECKKSL